MARSNSRGRNYVPFKWTKELIIFLSILAVAIILTIVCLIPTSKEKFMTEWSDAITAASGTALDDDHVFEYISLSKFETKKSEATMMSHLLFYMVLQLTLQLFLIYHQLIKRLKIMELIRFIF